MGFGTIITAGDDFAKLDDSLMGSLVEVRVEMDLSKPTKFGLRFEDDICGTNPKISNDKLFKTNTRFSIFVLHDKDVICLVSGRITEVKTSSLLGGSGSWVEYHGIDRRIEMERVEYTSTWSGLASTAAEALIKQYEFEPKVQPTLITYGTKENTLNQRGSDLAFIEEIARRNNMELWFEYAVTSEKGLLGGLEITQVAETLHLETSPERSQLSTDKAPAQFPALVPDKKKVLSVNPPSGQCATVNEFKATIDFEKPTAAAGFALDQGASKELLKQIGMPAEALGGRDTEGVKGATEREKISPPGPGDGPLLQLYKDSLVYEQSWFVTVEGSTTVRQAGFVLAPHQVVEVENDGALLSGPYQVTTATHVMTADEHYQDFTARANGLVGV